MKTIEKTCKTFQLEMAFIASLQKRIDTPITFDTTTKTIRLLSLRKEFLGKYAENEEGVYRYHFTADLLEDLKRRAACMDRADDFCVTLFCSHSEQPCILTISELIELSEWCGKEGYFNFSMEIEKRTFIITAYSNSGGWFEKTISKKVSSKKLLH
jgi:hypothetical protein